MGLPQLLPNLSQVTCLAEGTVSVVVVELAGPPFEKTRNAVVMLAHAVVTAQILIASGIFHKTTDKEVEPAVIVVVKPGRRSGPIGIFKASPCSHIGEGPIAIVVVKRVPPIGSDVEIRKSIRIVVCNGDSFAKRHALESGFCGNVCKGTVAIVSIQRIARPAA